MDNSGAWGLPLALCYLAVFWCMAFSLGFYVGKSSAVGGHNICDKPLTAIAIPKMKNANSEKLKEFKVGDWWAAALEMFPPDQAEKMALAIGMERGINRWVYRGGLPENSGLVEYLLLSIEDYTDPKVETAYLSYFFFNPENERIIRGIIAHQWFREHGIELGPGQVHQHKGELIYYPAIIDGLKLLADKGGKNGGE